MMYQETLKFYLGSMRMTMKTSDFYYDLPEELIAQHPLEKRSESRLLLLDKVTGEIQHKHFYDIYDELHEGDVLVLNDTKVLPARIYGTKSTGANVEFLLLKETIKDHWECLVKPGRRARHGDTFDFGSFRGEVKEILEDGLRLVKFTYDGLFIDHLVQLGEMPLPPYIHKTLEDQSRYQTVYAKELGSAAAPTAGLHFTEALLKKLEEKGVKITYVTLHVGLGTFRPVKVENIENHIMHSERYHMSKEAAATINQGKRVIAVGTTSVRTLEASYQKNGLIKEDEDDTSIFITPGFDFKIVDALITNFHLPESTLMMLVSALSTREHILRAYEEAVKEKYRFFSFGDAMFIR